MMLTKRTGAALRQTIDRMEETWAEMEHEPLNADSARLLQRDLFELLGMVKAFMLFIEDDAEVDDNA